MCWQEEERREAEGTQHRISVPFSVPSLSLYFRPVSPGSFGIQRASERANRGGAAPDKKAPPIARGCAKGGGGEVMEAAQNWGVSKFPSDSDIQTSLLPALLVLLSLRLPLPLYYTTILCLSFYGQSTPYPTPPTTQKTSCR